MKRALVAMIVFSFYVPAFAQLFGARAPRISSAMESSDGRYIMVSDGSKMYWGPKGGPLKEIETTGGVQAGPGGRPSFQFNDPRVGGETGLKWSGNSGSIKCGNQTLKFKMSDAAAAQRRLDSGELRTTGASSGPATKGFFQGKGGSNWFTNFFVWLGGNRNSDTPDRMYTGTAGKMREHRVTSTRSAAGQTMVTGSDGTTVNYGRRNSISNRDGGEVSLEAADRSKVGTLGIPGVKREPSPCDAAQSAADYPFPDDMKCLLEGLHASGRYISPKYVALVSLYLKRDGKLTTANFNNYIYNNGYCDIDTYGGLSSADAKAVGKFDVAKGNLVQNSTGFFNTFGVNPRVTRDPAEAGSGALQSSAQNAKGKGRTDFSACHAQMQSTKRDGPLFNEIRRGCQKNSGLGRPGDTGTRERNEYSRDRTPPGPGDREETGDTPRSNYGESGDHDRGGGPGAGPGGGTGNGTGGGKGGAEGATAR